MCSDRTAAAGPIECARSLRPKIEPAKHFVLEGPPMHTGGDGTQDAVQAFVQEGVVKPAIAFGPHTLRQVDEHVMLRDQMDTDIVSKVAVFVAEVQ